MRKQNNFQFNIANHDFIITPKKLAFNHRAKGQYLFELEKGGQRIKLLSEAAEFDNNKEYTFRSAEPIFVKSFKEKNMGLTWSLYKRVQDKLQFVEALKLDLSSRYTNYTDELKNLSFQFSRFLQCYSNNSNIRQSWANIKSQLRSHKVIEVLKNQTGEITFSCGIEIKSNFDYLAEQQPEKIHVLKKGSLSSQSNSSSRNSLKEKSKVIEEEKKKTPKKKDSFEKQQLSPVSVTSSEKPKNPENVPLNKVQYHVAPTQQQGIMIMPQLQLKTLTALSDILEASNEQSAPNTGEHTDRKPSEQGLAQEVTRNFKKTKTFHFGQGHGEKDEFKRNNSLTSIKFGSKVEDEQGNIQEMAAEQEEAKYEYDELTNQSTITKGGEVNIQQKYQQKETKVTFKHFAAILFIFVVFLGSAYTLTPLMQQRLKRINQLFKDNQRIKKGSINWHPTEKKL